MKKKYICVECGRRFCVPCVPKRWPKVKKGREICYSCIIGHSPSYKELVKLCKELDERRRLNESI